MDPTLTVLLVLLIGIVVGIAGAFIGFHVAALFAFSTLILLIGAIIGAGLIVWVWREVRL